VSVFAGVIAASLPAGARVLAPREDFTSLLFPFLAQEGRGVQVELVALDDLAEAIDARTDLVAFSAVQSADGRVADVDGIVAAARHHGARTVCDATQASGWLPLDASRLDATITAAYKWLLNPRGTAFMAVSDELRDELTPHAAGWYAADEPIASLYGAPLNLSATAKRFDVSPAWLSWVAGAPALRLLEEVGIEAIHAHDLRLANAFRGGLGLEVSNSAIVSLDVDEDAAQRCERAGVRCAGRGGRLRFSFHFYNDDGDVARALEVLA
jgi:selenocysteine lyase/cysteine desulfurase